MSNGVINRERELAAIESVAEAPRGQLAVGWGRRRTGKTYLLQAFIQDRRAIYYAATQ